LYLTAFASILVPFCLSYVVPSRLPLLCYYCRSECKIFIVCEWNKYSKKLLLETNILRVKEICLLKTWNSCSKHFIGNIVIFCLNILNERTNDWEMLPVQLGFSQFFHCITNNANSTHLLFLMHFNGCIIMPFLPPKFSHRLPESNILQLLNSGAVNFFGKKGIQLLRQKMRQMKRY
jgi:hypothetical protein